MTDAIPKSPFLVFQDLVDSILCDKLAEDVRVNPSLDREEKPMTMERYHVPSEETLFKLFKPLIPKLETHFEGFKYLGTEHLVFQQFPANGKLGEEPHCENAVYKRKKWIRVKDRDLTGVLWLKDYQDSPPFNLKTQVLGGKLEFPVYNFGFQAQKGTLVVYPANERFISLTSAVLVGELQCVKFHICGEGLWLYDPAKYPGDFRTWFSNIV
jgi:hypothetical protein